MLIARGVLIELLRRKEFHVLLILCAVFALGATLIRLVGIENAATAAFVLNLGLTFSSMTAIVLAIILAARQIPEEAEQRTLHSVLARPIDREAVVIGKWFSPALAGFIAFVSLSLFSFLAAGDFSSYSPILLLQLLVLQAVSIFAVSAIAIFTSLIAPRGIPVVATGLVFFFGGKFTSLLRAKFPDGGMAGPVELFTGLVPDFNRLNLVTRYTDGIDPLRIGDFLLLLLYGAVITLSSLAAAVVVFRRRAI
jgi:ABC-type transport system involved in multi-copper enzyme maturation permease subunit